MGLSEAMAGITLLALANGAGDVVTAVVASGGADGVAYNIGALFGAGLFVCSIVMSLTIIKSKEMNPKDKNTPKSPIIVDKNTIYRDLVYYIAVCLYVIALGAWGKITWYAAVILLAIYISQVFVVYF